MTGGDRQILPASPSPCANSRRFRGLERLASLTASDSRYFMRGGNHMGRREPVRDSNVTPRRQCVDDFVRINALAVHLPQLEAR